MDTEVAVNGAVAMVVSAGPVVLALRLPPPCPASVCRTWRRCSTVCRCIPDLDALERPDVVSDASSVCPDVEGVVALPPRCADCRSRSWRWRRLSRRA
ncbi:hypothetical protein QBC46DRAFT_370422 [Diplogelasinospora grovesii]|uniref:Uncharacterized protein n=1 Tax=Diplogelasinospora grovesii TaxID=303347 RepID=A0AAN6NI52_9PEZI|nr:hypothetical protein QBC46DRAFT_370422 [Diplogelasinospora grovesii]